MRQYSVSPEDIVNAGITIDAEENFRVKRGGATLRYWNGEAWDSKLDSKSVVPFDMGDGRISGGQKYATPIALALPTDAKTTMDGLKKDPE